MLLSFLDDVFGADVCGAFAIDFEHSIGVEGALQGRWSYQKGS